MRLDEKKVIIIFILIIAGMLFFYRNFIFKSVNRFFYNDMITHYATMYKLDPLFVCSVINEESKFFKYAVSKVGAIGLMQLMPNTAKDLAIELGIKNFTPEMLYNPEINVQIGCYYISKLIDYFNNDIILALCAYNAGITNAQKWRGYVKSINDIPFVETKYFVKRVLKNHKELMFENSGRV
jgi:soluble lytic murein transglycosylase